jgi:hypothetical protein
VPSGIGLVALTSLRLGAARGLPVGERVETPLRVIGADLAWSR